jgi:streptogramin lyase
MVVFDFPFAPKGMVLASPRGHVLVGNSGTAAFEVLDSLGNGRRVLLEGLDTVRVLPSDIAAHKNALLASVRDVVRDSLSPDVERLRKQNWRAWVDSIKFPSVHPLYATAAVDDAGRVWLQRPGSGPERTWNIYLISSGALVSKARVRHRGSVRLAVVKAGTLYCVEEATGGRFLLTQYHAP